MIEFVFVWECRVWKVVCISINLWFIYFYKKIKIKINKYSMYFGGIWLVGINADGLGI